MLLSSSGHNVWLRPPVYDSAGDGLSLLVRVDHVAHPPAITMPSMHKIEDVLSGIGQAAMKYGPGVLQAATGITPQMLSLANEYVVKPVDHWLGLHPAVKDGIIVAADVAGVVAGGVALFTLVTVGGATAAVVVGLTATVVAGFACLALMYEDGRHLWYVATGNEAGRIHLEKSGHYQWIEAIAPWLTLPDLVMGGRVVVRELAEASKTAGRIGTRASATAARATQATREFRETIADTNQSIDALNAAHRQANRAANDYRRMAALAQRANQNLLLKRNAVVATAGGAWAARQYINEMPVLTEKFVDKAKERARETGDHLYEQAERLVGARSGSAARPDTAAHLLLPRSPSPQASRTNLHITTMVTKRKARGR